MNAAPNRHRIPPPEATGFHFLVNAPGVSFAKTTRPSLAGVIPRERLFGRLDELMGKAVVWLTGPPGCGKTTLAASYLEARKPASLWYQLDEGDADVASFFYYLGLASEQAGKRKPALPQLTPEYHAGLPAFTRRYFQALYQRLGPSFAIVFDGYHEVPAQSVFHEVMRIALAEVPPGGAVVLISRSDPPAAMARLRANRALEVIGWRDMRLTQAESNALVAQRGHQMAGDALVEMYNRTQGWAAGLILMLEQAPSYDPFAAAPDLANPGLVFDYLAGELFQKTDPPTRELLLATAYLPQMTAAMAQELAGTRDANALLAELYRNNNFVSLKQAQPQAVYQCHPLLREFLLARANETFDRERRAVLQRRSAELLEAEGLVVEAASLLRAIGDWGGMVALIERHGPRMFRLGMGETLVHWVDMLPKESQERNPWMLYWKAASRLCISPRESRLLQEQAYERFAAQPAADPRALLLTASGAMDAILYEVDDFSLLDRWIMVVEGLLKRHPELLTADLEARIASSLLASMSVRQPHHPDLPRWVERGYRASLAHDDANLRMLSEWRIALSIMWEGHFPKSLAVIEGMRKLAREREVSPFALSTLKLAEASYFMLTNDRESCLAATRAGIEIERAEGVNVISYQLLANGAGGALMAGDLESAGAMLKQFAELKGTPARFDLCLYHLFSTWHALLRQDSVAAYQQQKLALTMAIEVGCPTYMILCHLGAAQVHYQGGEERKALAHLQQVYDLARPIKSHLIQFTGLLNYAWLALDTGRRPHSGLRALRYSLEMGKLRDFTAFLLWRPELLARLCSFALEAGIEPDFVSALVRQRGLALDASRDALAGWPWPYRAHTLGAFRVLKNGAPLTFSGKAQKRPLEMLKVIIARGGREVSEEHVTEAMWPRIDGDSAHRSFTTTLHRLRKLLGEDRAIVLSEGKLTLDGRYLWTDCWAFEQLTARADQLLRGPRERIEPDKLAALSGRLVELYAGPFLGNEPEEAWSLPMRDRLRTRFVRCVGEISRYWQNAGEPERTVELLERALEADGLAESLYRHLMLCHAQAERRAEAVETYNRCRKTLAAALKVEPSPETRALYEKILQPT
jgi:ATP/maltotriose-dependent transcriptional regulator MalT/DNA-binding SARP family transcriptional activator